MAPSWPCSSWIRRKPVVWFLGGGDNPAMKEMDDISTSLFSAEITLNVAGINILTFVVPIIRRFHWLPPLYERTRDIATRRVVNCGYLNPYWMKSTKALSRWFQIDVQIMIKAFTSALLLRLSALSLSVSSVSTAIYNRSYNSPSVTIHFVSALVSSFRRSSVLVHRFSFSSFPAPQRIR